MWYYLEQNIKCEAKCSNEYMYVKKHSVKPLLLIYLSEHDKHNL